MEVSRNKWPIVKVTATKRNQNGLVGSVYQKIRDLPEAGKAKNIVEQPANKIVLLLKSNVFNPH